MAYAADDPLHRLGAPPDGLMYDQVTPLPSSAPAPMTAAQHGALNEQYLRLGRFSMPGTAWALDSANQWSTQDGRSPRIVCGQTAAAVIALVSEDPEVWAATNQVHNSLLERGLMLVSQQTQQPAGSGLARLVEKFYRDELSAMIAQLFRIGLVIYRSVRLFGLGLVYHVVHESLVRLEFVTGTVRGTDGARRRVYTVTSPITGRKLRDVAVREFVPWRPSVSGRPAAPVAILAQIYLRRLAKDQERRLQNAYNRRGELVYSRVDNKEPQTRRIREEDILAMRGVQGSQQAMRALLTTERKLMDESGGNEPPILPTGSALPFPDTYQLQKGMRVWHSRERGTPLAAEEPADQREAWITQVRRCLCLAPEVPEPQALANLRTLGAFLTDLVQDQISAGLNSRVRVVRDQRQARLWDAEEGKSGKDLLLQQSLEPLGQSGTRTDRQARAWQRRQVARENALDRRAAEKRRQGRPGSKSSEAPDKVTTVKQEAAWSGSGPKQEAGEVALRHRAATIGHSCDWVDVGGYAVLKPEVARQVESVVEGPSEEETDGQAGGLKVSVAASLKQALVERERAHQEAVVQELRVEAAEQKEAQADEQELDELADEDLELLVALTDWVVVIRSSRAFQLEEDLTTTLPRTMAVLSQAQSLEDGSIERSTAVEMIDRTLRRDGLEIYKIWEEQNPDLSQMTDPPGMEREEGEVLEGEEEETEAEAGRVVVEEEQQPRLDDETPLDREATLELEEQALNHPMRAVDLLRRGVDESQTSGRSGSKSGTAEEREFTYAKPPSQIHHQGDTTAKQRVVYRLARERLLREQLEQEAQLAKEDEEEAEAEKMEDEVNGDEAKESGGEEEDCVCVHTKGCPQCSVCANVTIGLVCRHHHRCQFRRLRPEERAARDAERSTADQKRQTTRGFSDDDADDDADGGGSRRAPKRRNVGEDVADQRDRADGPTRPKPQRGVSQRSGTSQPRRRRQPTAAQTTDQQPKTKRQRVGAQTGKRKPGNA